MLSPCMPLVGLSIAPLPATRILCEFSLFHALHEPAAGDGRHTAASAAARVRVLFLGIQARSAVHQDSGIDVFSTLVQKLDQKLPSDPSEVAGGHKVIIIERPPGVLEVRTDRGAHGGRHRRAHVVRVLDLVIDHSADVFPP